MKKALACAVLILALVTLWGLNTDNITVDSPALIKSIIPAAHSAVQADQTPDESVSAQTVTSNGSVGAAADNNQVQVQAPQAPVTETPAPTTPAASPPEPAGQTATAPPKPVVPPAPAPSRAVAEPVPADLFAAGDKAESMLAYVNAARAAVNLPPLVLDPILCQGAYIKSKDMAVNGYFSHTSPTYGDCFDMMDSLGVKRSLAGENIAINTTVSSAHQAFMNSPGHRANILNTRFRKLGAGFYQSGGKLYVTEWFTD